MNIPENNTRRCYKMDNLFVHFLHKHLPIDWVIITIDVPVVGLYKFLKENMNVEIGTEAGAVSFSGST